MKTTKLTLLSAVLMLSLLMGCNSEEADKTDKKASAKDETITFVLGTAAPVSETNVLWQYCEKFAQLVKEASGGKIIIENHHAGELGGERDLFEGVQLGTIDMCFISSGPVGNFAPKVLASDFPFLFRDWDHVNKVFGGEIGDRLAKEIETAAGVKMLDWAANGFRQFCNAVKPVSSPTDIKGLKVRTMENKIHMESFAALGASPTPMDGGELYTSLQQGTVDGMEGPLGWILPSKFTEVQDYMAITNHFYAPSVFAMNKAKFDKLSPEQQKIIMDAAEQATKFQVEFAMNLDAKLIEEAKKMGVNVATEIDKSKFRSVCQPVYDAHPEFAEILAEIQSVK